VNSKSLRQNKQKPRFPRNPTAKDVGELAKQVWKVPVFHVKETSLTTTFVLKLNFSLTERIKSENETYHRLLFTTTGIPLYQALKQAYKDASYSSKTMPALFDGALFAMFRQSLKMLFEKAQTAQGLFKGHVEGNANSVLEESKRRRSPDLERRSMARRMAKRREELFPRVKELHKFIKNRPERSDEARLKLAVETNFSDEWIKHVTQGNALHNLPRIPGHEDRTESLGGLKWTPLQLTVGIIMCEALERNPHFALDPNTVLEVYLPFGRKLNAKSK
jgi:hypothetical protein